MQDNESEEDNEVYNLVKLYQNELANSINNPNSINCEQNTKLMITQFEKLCSLQYNTCYFLFDGSANCILCEKYIGNEKYITLNCSCNVHVECGKTKVLSISETLGMNIYIECDHCKQLWTRNNIVQLFGKQEIQRRQEEADQKCIEQIQKEEQQQQKIREQNCQFTCQICFKRENVNDDCITLDCDHRFCQNCIKQCILQNFQNGRLKQDELVCPQCGNSISPQILQALMTMEQFDQVCEGRLKDI